MVVKDGSWKRNIHGFVKNRTEYEVEALLPGHEKDVEDVVRLCRKGPSSSKVESIKIEDYQQEYTKKSFYIL